MQFATNHVYQASVPFSRKVLMVSISDSFTVRPGMHVHVSCGKNYIRTPGVTSSRLEVSYRKTKTSSGGFKKGLSLLWLCHYRERKEN